MITSSLGVLSLYSTLLSDTSRPHLQRNAFRCNVEREESVTRRHEVVHESHTSYLEHFLNLHDHVK